MRMGKTADWAAAASRGDEGRRGRGHTVGHCAERWGSVSHGPFVVCTRFADHGGECAQRASAGGRDSCSPRRRTVVRWR